MSHKARNNYDMIKIDNKLFQLTTEEFYVYCWLRYRYVAYELNCTTASIDLVADKVKFIKDKTRNKQKIKNILLKLEQDKIISIHYLDKLRNSTTLEIAFNNMNPAEYTALDYKYVHINDHQELYVIATIRRWQHAKDKTLSLPEWASILDVSVPTVLAIFDRMEDKGLLRVESGEYYNNEKGELRQENNKYFLVGVDDDGRQTDDIDTKEEAVLTEAINTQQPEVDEANTNEVQQNTIELKNKQTYFMMFNVTYNVQEILERLQYIGKEKIYMQEVDYVWYQLNKQFLDKKTVNLVEAKIRGMKNSKHDYPKQQLDKWQETWRIYNRQQDKDKIKELAETQPVLVFNDDSYTTDIDSFSLDYDNLKEIYYLYNNIVVSSTFDKWNEDALGNMVASPRNTEEKMSLIDTIADLYKQKQEHVS